MEKINQKEVLSVIQNALKLEGKTVTMDSSVGNVTEWDSLGHLSILVALDKLFEGKISGIKEMAAADSVRKIIQSLKDNALI